MNSTNKEILDFKNKYLSENKKRCEEILKDPCYSSLINIKKRFSIRLNLEEVYGILDNLKNNKIPDSDKDIAYTYLLINLMAIPDYKLEDNKTNNVRVRRK